MKKILALVAALLTAGCAQLPTGISVSQGPELLLPLTQDFSYYSPPGPFKDASPQEIVTGFLNAGSAPQQNYEIAREYLSSQFAQNWQPNAGVLIRSGIPILRATSQSLVTAEIPVAARINELGIYEAADASDRPSLRFQLIQEGGQWRISRAPNLTVVTVPVFNVVFRGYPIYFLDASRQNLVPDLRWFPSRTSTGTSLVNALLAGPADWLAPAVISAIPSGTKLTVDAVQVIDGEARIDFDANALTAQPGERALMKSQLEATLVQLFGVQRVQISINNNPQNIEAADLRRVSAGTATAFNERGLFSLTSGAAQVFAGTAEIAQKYKIQNYDLSFDGQVLVIQTEDSIAKFSLSNFGSEFELETAGAGLLPVQLDSYGNSWLVPSDNAQPARTLTSTNEVAEIQWNSLGNRVAFAVSPEGSRVAEIYQIESSFRLVVRPVIRDLSGIPKSVGDAQRVIDLQGTKQSLAWDNLTSLIAFDTASGELNSLQAIPVVGPKQALPSTSVIPKMAVAGYGNASRYLLSQGNEVWVLTGRSWRKVSESVLAIAMQD